MDPTTALQAMQTWPADQQLEFLFQAWDQLVDSGWQPDLTEEMRAELDRRLAAHEANPGNALTWDQVLSRLSPPPA